MNAKGWVPALLAISGAMVLAISCSTVPVTGRSQLNLVSSDQLTQMGMTSFEKMKQEMPISRDPAANALVQRVGKRIAAVADLPNAQWEFVVFDSKEPNAFALPGGKVGVNTGIFPITKTEAGLATVIGHEVAHAAARHGGERISQALLLEAGGQFLGAGLSGASPAMQQAASIAYGLSSQVGVALPHSRSQESEADHIGLIYMARAGYDPAAALEFWERFAEYGRARGSSAPWFLRTHPIDDVRMRQLRQWLPEAMREYQPRLETSR